MNCYVVRTEIVELVDNGAYEIPDERVLYQWEQELPMIDVEQMKKMKGEK